MAIFLPPPAPPPLPARVIQLPANAVELGVNILGGFREETAFKIHPDRLPEKPMSAKEAVNKLYERKHLIQTDKKQALIVKLSKFSQQDENMPGRFFDTVDAFMQTRVLDQEDIETLVHSYNPDIVLGLASLFKKFIDYDGAKVVSQETRVMAKDFFTKVRELPEENILAALKK